MPTPVIGTASTPRATPDLEEMLAGMVGGPEHRFDELLKVLSAEHARVRDENTDLASEIDRLRSQLGLAPFERRAPMAGKYKYGESKPNPRWRPRPPGDAGEAPDLDDVPSARSNAISSQPSQEINPDSKDAANNLQATSQKDRSPPVMTPRSATSSGASPPEASRDRPASGMGLGDIQSTRSATGLGPSGSARELGFGRSLSGTRASRFTEEKDASKKHHLERKLQNQKHLQTIEASQKADSCLARLVQNEHFGMFSALCILLNSIYIGIQTSVTVAAEMRKYDGLQVDEDIRWLYGDIVFCLVFAVELAVRLAVDRWAFVVGREKYWNVFDFCVVVTSIFEVICDVADITLNLGISVLRTLRVVRILRVLRVANSFAIVRNLKTMLYSITGSAMSFLSAIIMLSTFMYIFALLFMQGVKGYMKKNPDPKVVLKMKEHYGRLDLTMWTLMGSVTGGYDWAPVAEPMQEIGVIYTFFFIVYICFTLLGLLNILNGIFVNAAVKASEMNRELAIDSIVEQREMMYENMVSLFSEADEDQSGTVTFEEFQMYLHDEKIKAYFQTLDLDISSVERIFNLLDSDGWGEIDLTTFVEGCIKLRGPAKVVDMSVMQQEYGNLENRIRSLQASVRGLEVHLVERNHENEQVQQNQEFEASGMV